MTCVCPRADLGDGEERVEWPDPDCPEHGRQGEWRAGDPLRKYARPVEEDGCAWGAAARLERPREVEERLLRELAG